MIVFAHAGHWLTSLAFMLPPLGFMVWLGYVTVKERRSRGDGDE
jgi:hypothetical protein